MFNNPLNSNPKSGQAYPPQHSQQAEAANPSVLKFINGHYNTATDNVGSYDTFTEAHVETTIDPIETQSEGFLTQVWDQFLDLFTEEDIDERSPVGIGRLNDLSAQTFAPSSHPTMGPESITPADTTSVNTSNAPDQVYRRNHQTPDFRFQQLISKTRGADQVEDTPPESFTISSAAGWDVPSPEALSKPVPMPRLSSSHDWNTPQTEVADTNSNPLPTPAPVNPFQRVDFKPVKQPFPKIQNAWKQ